MPQYNNDKVYDDWSGEVGRLARTLRKALTEHTEQKQDWDEYKGGLSLNRLAKVLQRHTEGTAQGGGPSKITLADDGPNGKPDDHWNGGTIELLTGPGAGETNDCTDYDEATKDYTVGTAWTVEPTSATTYRIEVDVSNLENAIKDGNKIKRVAMGQIAHTPASDLMPNLRKYT